MLIKFTRGGRGGGGQIAAYLTAHDREGRGHAPPEVVRGDMDRTRDLIDSIETYIEVNNEHPTPYRWTATAEEILAKVQRARATLDQVVNQY